MQHFVDLIMAALVKLISSGMIILGIGLGTIQSAHREQGVWDLSFGDAISDGRLRETPTLPRSTSDEPSCQPKQKAGDPDPDALLCQIRIG